MTTDEAKSTCITVMRQAEVAVLATIDGEGYPHTRGMLNLWRAEQFPGLAAFFSGHHDDLAVYFTTNTSSAKVPQIRANGRVSVYYCLPGTYYGVTLLGVAEVVDDAAEKELLWQPGWEMYYPGGVTDPDYAVVRLRPAKARLYHGLRVVEVAL
ncbi:MAG: pyridoxamine 5'-phosphate oxidase family protein [Anaerolineae bacterium]